MVTAAFCFCAPVLAQDVHVDSDTYFVAYEVRSPGAPALMTRRRLVQNLGARYSNPLNGDAEGREPATRIDVNVRLRFDQDFGDNCLLARDLCVRATNENDPASFQPLANDSRIDVPELWVAVQFPEVAIEARLGRQAKVLPIGFLRLDGVNAVLRPTSWLSLDAYGGLWANNTSFLASDGFGLDGRLTLDRERAARDSDVFSSPLTTWIGGAGLEVGVSEIVRPRIEFQYAESNQGIARQRLGLSAVSRPLDFLHISGRATYDMVEQRVTRAHAGVEVLPTGGISTRADVSFQRPSFDPGVIWGFFSLVPITDFSLGGSIEADTASQSPIRRIGWAVRARHAAFEQNPEWNAGLEAHLGARFRPLRIVLDAFGWLGDLGPSGGFSCNLSTRIGRQWELYGRASLWHFEDSNRQVIDGVSLSEGLGVKYQLAESVHTRADLQHAFSEASGHRFRLLLALGIEVWR